MAHEKLTAANRKYRAEMLRARREERVLQFLAKSIAQIMTE